MVATPVVAAESLSWPGARIRACPQLPPPSAPPGAVIGVTLWRRPVLSMRVFRCHACGLEVDRDLNAARNLEKLVESVQDVAGSGPEALTDHGGDVSPG